MARKKPVATTRKGMPPAGAKKPAPAGTVFQFKITLLGVKPPIWRRIQAVDCTLDKLHEHIHIASAIKSE